jgi:exonuclease VII large subunit
MSRILDLQKKANDLLLQHQSDIDEKLNSEISQIFKDMRNTVRSEAQSLSSSIDSTKTDIQQKQSEATNEILQQIDQTTAQTKKQQQQGMTALLQEQQQQIKQLQANLQQLNGLSQETAQAAKLKKTLITSNIALISLACITLISSICLGYVSKSKYNDITEMENKVNYLKSQGGA